MLTFCPGLKPQLVARLTKVLKTEESNAGDNEEEVEQQEDGNEEDGTAAAAEDDEADGGDDEAAAIDEAFDSIGMADEGDVGSEVTSTVNNAEATPADIDMADIMVIDEYDSTKEKNVAKEVIYLILIHFFCCVKCNVQQMVACVSM